MEGPCEQSARIVAEVKRKFGDTACMAQLAVKWVLQNPQPTELKQVGREEAQKPQKISES